MGTRHLIGAVIDGDFKIAQYGQWDGYPSGQGLGVLEFLRTVDLPDFKEQVRGLRWATQADEQAMDDALGTGGSSWITMEQADELRRNYPAMSRDTGSSILTLVADGDVQVVRDSRSFALDSLFCEWAYVIDLDRDVLEVYRGFQQTPPQKGRWAGQWDEFVWRENKDYRYYAVELVAEYPLGALPDGDEFVYQLGKED